MVRFTLGLCVASVVAVSVTLAVWLAGASTALASGWAIQSTPNHTGASQSSLSGVSCTSAAACTAVGNYKNSAGTVLTLAEQWNGTKWTIQPTPNHTGASQSSLSGVSCTSAAACTAVGNYKNSAGTVLTLAEQWNGTNWTIQPTPNPTGASQSSLSGVSCTSAAACTAVGNYVTSSGVNLTLTLAERWNGSAWTIQQTANPGVSAKYWVPNVLTGVSCTTSTACTAVGWDRLDGCGIFHCNIDATLAEGWNGASWTVQSGLPGYRFPIPIAFEGVSCSAAASCAAVGSYNGSTLAASWNGTTWATQSTPNPSGATSSDLASVSCASAAACTAVGQSGRTLAEAWNGTTWTIQPTANHTAATSSRLNSVSCTTSAACTAVGYYTNSAGNDLTLAEHHS